MQKFSTIILGIILVISAIIIILVITSTPGGQPEPETKIAATIFPIYDIARNIAGDNASVNLITPPGASPHTFEITAEQIRNLQNTDILFAIGLGLDDWIAETRNAIPGSQVKTVSKGIVFRETEEHGHENEHKHGEADPHYWLNIENAIKITKTIRDSLIEIDPNNAAQYSANATDYVGELQTAGEQIKALFTDLDNNKIITMHNAWGYFSDEYGLEITSTFEPFPGQEPTAKYLAELSNLTKEHNIKIIFSEPQLSNQVLIPFLNDLGLKLAVLDPLGGLDERDSYINTMLYNAKTIQENLK